MDKVTICIDVGGSGFWAKARVRQVDNFDRFASAVFGKVGVRQGDMMFASADGRKYLLDEDSFADYRASGYPCVEFRAPAESGQPGSGRPRNIHTFQTFEEMRDYYQGRGLAVRVNKWRAAKKYYKLRCTYKLDSGSLCTGSGKAYYNAVEDVYVVHVNDDHGVHSKRFTSKAKLGDDVKDFIINQMSYGVPPAAICSQARDMWPRLVGKIEQRTCTNVYYNHQLKTKKHLAGASAVDLQERAAAHFREFRLWAASESGQVEAATFLEGPGDAVKVIYTNNASSENFCSILASPNMIRCISATGSVCVDGKQDGRRGRYPLISVLSEGANRGARLVFVAVCSPEEECGIWQQIAECLATWGREIHGDHWSVRCLLADRAPVIDEGFRTAGLEGYARGSCLFHVIRNCDEKLVYVGLGKEERAAALAEIRTIASCASEEQLLLCARAYERYWRGQGESMKKFAAFFSGEFLAPRRRGWFAGALPVGFKADDVSREGLESYYKRAYASQRLGLVQCCRALQGRILPGFSVGRIGKNEKKTIISYKLQEIASGMDESMLVVDNVGYAWSAQGALPADRPFFTAADLADRQSMMQKTKLTKDEADKLLRARVVTADSCSCSHFTQGGYCSHFLAFTRKVGKPLPHDVILAASGRDGSDPVRAKLSASEKRELQNVQKSHICGVCNRWCGNTANLKSHEEGRAHRDALSRLTSSLPDNSWAPVETDPGGYGDASETNSHLPGENCEDGSQQICQQDQVLATRRGDGDRDPTAPAEEIGSPESPAPTKRRPAKVSGSRQRGNKRPREEIGSPESPAPTKRRPAKVSAGPTKRVLAALRGAEYQAGHWLTGVEIILAESVFANHVSFKSAVARNYFARHMTSAMGRRSAANEITHWGGVWVVNSANAGSAGFHWAAAHAVWDEFGGVVVNVVDSLSGESFAGLTGALNARANCVAHLHGLKSQRDEWSCGYQALYFALQMSECAGKGDVFNIRALARMPEQFVGECNSVLASFQTHGGCPRRPWR